MGHRCAYGKNDIVAEIGDADDAEDEDEIVYDDYYV